MRYRQDRPSTYQDRRQAALMAALSLAMALSDRAARVEIDRALFRAVLRTREALPSDDPVWLLVRAISRDWQELQRNPEAREGRGQDLMRAVERATWPAPVGRIDIEG